MHEEEEGYLRLGWKLSVFTLCTFTYVTLALVDFYWFVGSVLIVCLTEGTGLVVYSTLVAKWARWYCQGRAEKIAAQRTRRLPGASARTIRPAHQFDLLRTDTINCLRAIRLRRG